MVFADLESLLFNYFYSFIPAFVMILLMTFYLIFVSHRTKDNKHAVILLILITIQIFLTIADKYLGTIEVIYRSKLDVSCDINTYAFENGFMFKNFVACRYVISSISYCFKTLIIILFWLLFRREKQYGSLNDLLILSPFLIYVVLVISSFFTHFIFYIEDYSGIYVDGSLHFLVIFVPIIYAGPIIYETLLRLRSKTFREFWFILAIIVLFIAVTLIEMKYTIDYQIPIVESTMIIVLVFYYLFIISNKNEEELDKLNEIIRKKNSDIRLTKLKNSFVSYTIDSICDQISNDPTQAIQTIKDFKQFLEYNTYDESENDLSKFVKEIEHVKLYVSIEQKKYKDLIDVKYNLQNLNFNFPRLSMQPIVQAFIEQGIARNGKCDIEITSFEEKGYYLVSVSSLCCDFVSTLVGNHKTEDFENLKYRIETLCNGKVSVHNDTNSESKIVIYVPKNL